MSKRARRPAISASAAALPLALGLFACGGSSTRHELQSGNGSDVGGTAGVGAVAGMGASSGVGAGTAGSAGIGGSADSAGSAGSAGSGGACVEICPDRMLDNFEAGGYGRLQVAGSDEPAGYGVPTEPPRGGSLLACHVSDEAELGGMNLGYHQHQAPFWGISATDPDLPYGGVRLWARRGSAGGTSSLVVAVTGLERELGDYQDDLETGNPWLAYRFLLTDEWQEYSALFRDFAPEGPGTVESTWDAGGQVIHFVVPRGEPLDVWIDDIELVCTVDVCE